MSRDSDAIGDARRIVERAAIAANAPLSIGPAGRAMFAVMIEHERLAAAPAGELVVRALGIPVPKVQLFWADFNFLVIGLTRLLDAAIVFSQARGVNIDEALEAYQSALPTLERLRQLDKPTNDPALLAFGSWDGRTIRWLGVDLHIDDALWAAIDLFKALCAADETLK